MTRKEGRGGRSRSKDVKDSKDNRDKAPIRAVSPLVLYVLAVLYVLVCRFPRPPKSPAPSRHCEEAGRRSLKVRLRAVQSSGPLVPAPAPGRRGRQYPPPPKVAQRRSLERAGRAAAPRPSRTPAWNSGWKSAGWVVTRTLSVSIPSTSSPGPPARKGNSSGM